MLVLLLHCTICFCFLFLHAFLTVFDSLNILSISTKQETCVLLLSCVNIAEVVQLEADLTSHDNYTQSLSLFWDSVKYSHTPGQTHIPLSYIWEITNIHDELELYIKLNIWIIYVHYQPNYADTLYLCIHTPGSNETTWANAIINILWTQCTLHTSYTHTHIMSIICFVSHKRAPLTEDNIKVNLTHLVIWRGHLSPHCQSKFLWHTSLCLIAAPCVSPSFKHLFFVVVYLTVWWRHKWKQCLAEIL